MNLNLPHLVTISDLFATYDVRKFKGDGNIKRKYKCEDKKALVKKIFLRYLYILMTDIIEGGKTFLFPSRQYLELQFRQIKTPALKNAIQQGAFSKVDIIACNFKFYEPMLVYKSKGHIIQRPIKLSANFVDRLIEKANTGYKYA